jgi:hypothetical protein
MERLNLQNLDKCEIKKSIALQSQYVSSFGKFDENVEMNWSWKSTRENIKHSAKHSVAHRPVAGQGIQAVAMQ